MKSLFSRFGKNLAYVAMFLLSVAALAVSGRAAHAEDITRGGQVTVAIPEAFTGFGPYDKRGRVDYLAIVNIFDTLVTYGPDYVPKGMLAERWENPDENTWVFHLRQGVKFHDGTNFDANAVKFALEKIRESNFKSQIEPITEINVKDDYTVELKVKSAFITLPAVLSQPFSSIVSPTAFNKLGAEEFAKHPVGTGPFKFVSWDPRAELKVEKNPEYWMQGEDGKPFPYLDTASWKILPDPEASVLALLSSEVDMITTVPFPMIPSLKASDEVQVSEALTTGWDLIMLSSKSEPFNNRSRRRAVQYGIDRAAIIDSVYLGNRNPALGPLSPRSWAYDANIEKQGTYTATSNPEKAREEVAAAGGNFSFKLTYPTQAPFPIVAQAIKDQLSQSGIEVVLEGKEIGAVLDDYFAGNFQALMIDWAGRIDEHLQMWPFYHSAGFRNFGGYKNEEVDSLLDQAGRVAAIPERAKLYQSAQTLINEDAPVIIVSFPSDIKAYSRNVQGFVNLADERARLYTVWRSASN